jgi:1A family penicillin-binding protein
MPKKSKWTAPFRFMRSHPKGLARILFVLALGIGLATGLGFGSWQSACRDCPSIAQIYVYEPKQATKILDHNGKLIAELFQERRTPVAIKDLPVYVPEAFVSVEDRRFYKHHGIDYIRLVGANLRNVLHGRITGGGSTITQQLARNMFRNQVGFEQKVTRKIKEAKVAKEIELVYSKDQILEAYLNQINFGHGWYGIETAAERYFGKPAATLTPAEAAMLAALPKAPERYSPFRNADRARNRRNLVLGMMADEGYLTQAVAERWKSAPLPDQPKGGEEGELAPYFVEWMRDQLDERFGSDLYRRGLRVYTSLDVEMQRRALDAMKAGWAHIESRPGYDHPKYDAVMAVGGSPKDKQTGYLQGLFIAMDPATGEIRAMIGGRNFNDSKFNRAVQAKRQAGSTFKPFVYVSALASGIPASHVIFDSPLSIDMPTGEVYAPRNYDATFNGPLTLRDALKKSINIVAVKLGMEVGLQTVAQTARNMGITTPVPPYPSIAIGSPDVIPLEMASAYTGFAQQGVRASPQAILRIEDATGGVIWQSHVERKAVIDSLPAIIIRDMMRDVVDHGTAIGARDDKYGLPYTVAAAGKTGTTNDATDVWFIGFTPDLLGAVWFGFDKPQKIYPGADGGKFAAPVWGAFMRSVYVGPQPLKPVPRTWELPAGITTRRVDRETGKLATELCPSERVYSEIFIAGTEPTETCDGSSPGLFTAPVRVPLDSLAGKPLPPVKDTSKVKVDPKAKF